MSGSAILGDNLVDDLVPDVDELRADLNADFGTRQFRVFRVRRRWTGESRGDGAIVKLLDDEILPAPDFLLPDNLRALSYELPAVGRLEEGDAVLKEVSLSYTFTELQGGTLGPTEEFFYRVVDALGQGIPTRYFVLASPPATDRAKSIGWIVPLRRAEIAE